MKRLEHENAMKKAQYEDELRSQRKDRDLQKELAAKQREEELKRRKCFGLVYDYHAHRGHLVYWNQYQNNSNDEEARNAHAL